MTPDELAALLKVLRSNGVANAEVPTTRGTLRVWFDVLHTDAPLPGQAPTPGGWKSPERLDSMTQFDEPRNEAP